jgi:hypothetical protein
MDPNTWKRLIDEHANDDLSTAPDESDILDAALDLEQSLGQQGLVQGQPAVPLFSDDLPRFEKQGNTESNVKKGNTADKRIPTKEGNKLAEVPDEEVSESKLSRSAEAPSGQTTSLLEGLQEDDAGVKESPSKTRQKSRVLEVSDEEDDMGGDDVEIKKGKLTPSKAVDRGSDRGDEDDETKQESKELISHIFGESGEESSGPEDSGAEDYKKQRKRKNRDNAGNVDKIDMLNLIVK